MASKVRVLPSPPAFALGFGRRSHPKTVAITSHFRYDSAISRRDLPEFCKNRSRLLIEGAGKAGCSLHPQPRVRNKIKHTSVVTTGSDGFSPAFPAQWF